jgi:hypothetical protein
MSNLGDLLKDIGGSDTAAITVAGVHWGRQGARTEAGLPASEAIFGEARGGYRHPLRLQMDILPRRRLTTGHNVRRREWPSW